MLFNSQSHCAFPSPRFSRRNWGLSHTPPLIAKSRNDPPQTLTPRSAEAVTVPNLHNPLSPNMLQETLGSFGSGVPEQMAQPTFTVTFAEALRLQPATEGRVAPEVAIESTATVGTGPVAQLGSFGNFTTVAGIASNPGEHSELAPSVRRHSRRRSRPHFHISLFDKELSHDLGSFGTHGQSSLSERIQSTARSMDVSGVYLGEYPSKVLAAVISGHMCASW